MCKDVSELSTEELLKIIAEQGRKWPRNTLLSYMLQSLVAIALSGGLIYFLEYHAPPEQFVHLWTFFGAVIILIFPAMAASIRIDKADRQFDALVELLRKSNVINS